MTVDFDPAAGREDTYALPAPRGEPVPASRIRHLIETWEGLPHPDHDHRRGSAECPACQTRGAFSAAVRGDR